MSKPGDPYRPINGSEGFWFEEKFCDRCRRNRPNANDGGCKIIMKSLVHNIDESGYPKEWTSTNDGEPTCTAFSDKSKPVENQRPKPIETKNQKDFLGDLK